MRTRWWQSIRWRLALGSMLVSLLATALLALAVIFAITYYYGVDQTNRLNTFAADSAQDIGVNFALHPILAVAAHNIFPNGLAQTYQGEQYLLIVLNHKNQVAYPRLGTNRTAFAVFGIALADPNLHKGSLNALRPAILSAQSGQTYSGQLGSSGPIAFRRPFIVQPIFNSGNHGSAVIGVLLVTPLSAAENTIPPFLSAVGVVVLVASLVVAILAALAAILFSRIITRPLAQLTRATRVLASGDYSAQVTMRSHGELEELANTFNEMAAKLANDVRELQQQEQWRRELIMNITHDLATPLTSIAGLGESLVDGVNKSYEDYEATGRVIVRETLRLRRLVKDLHMMTKVEAKAIEPQRQPQRLAPFIDEVVAAQITEFERADVEPRNVIPFNLPPVNVDPDMLARVFSNLFNNALRHTPPGGSITIDAAQHGNQVVVAVTDTGEGIARDALPRVFDRFYRGDSARSTTTGGSGLGLAIVRAIIEAHGGAVWAENVPNAGARFLFTLPLDTSPLWNMPTLPMSTTPSGPGSPTLPMSPPKSPTLPLPRQQR
jgi:signal transduction histidine kinase